MLAKYLECPVNPADINVVQGTYPLRHFNTANEKDCLKSEVPIISVFRPPLPATVGGEGVAEIVATGVNLG